VEHQGKLATRKQATIGEPFNPRYEACGFHPEEIVSRRRDLTDGQKWLYERLVRWARSVDGVRANERAGEVWRSHKNIAAELGKSERQVRRDLKRLESLGLLKPRIRDGRKSNTYVFLFHVWFERTMTSSQIISDERSPRRSSVSAQNHACEPERPLASGRLRPVNAAFSGHPRPPNQKGFNQKEESSSSPDRHSGRLEEPTVPSELETTKKSFLSPPWQNTPARQPWTQEELEEASGILTAYTKDFFLFLRVDIATVDMITAYMESAEDLRLWLESSAAILKSAKTWGLFVTDAKQWPLRRVLVKKQANWLALHRACQHGERPAEKCVRCAQERVKEQEEHALQDLKNRGHRKGWRYFPGLDNCKSCAGFGRDPDSEKICSCKAGRAYHEKLTACPRCANEGVVKKPEDAAQNALYLVEWCECEHGDRLRRVSPERVTESNAIVTKLRGLNTTKAPVR